MIRYSIAKSMTRRSVRPHAIGAGFFIGVVAFVCGLALSAVTMIGWRLTAPHDLWIGDWTAGSITSIDMYAWTFYSAHFVGISWEEGLIFGENFRILAHSPIGHSNFLFYLIPLVVLVVGGFAISYLTLSAKASITQYAVRGTTIAIGYGVTAIVGTAIFHGQTTNLYREGIYVMRPDLGYTILLIGFLYPIALGGIGGLFAKAVVESGAIRLTG